MSLFQLSRFSLKIVATFAENEKIVEKYYCLKKWLKLLGQNSISEPSDQTFRQKF